MRGVGRRSAQHLVEAMLRIHDRIGNVDAKRPEPWSTYGDQECLDALDSRLEIVQPPSNEVPSRQRLSVHSTDYRSRGARSWLASPCCYTPCREADRHGHHPQRGGRTSSSPSRRWPGLTKSSSSIPAAPMEPWTSPGGTRRGWRSSTGPATERRRTARRTSHRTTGSCRSTPTSTCRPIWPTKSAASCEHPDAAGYRIPRVTWYLGRWIRSTDWYPDPQLRLYDRRAGRWSLRQVHESVELPQPPGRLTHELEHYAYRDVSHHLRDYRSLHDARRGTVGSRGPAHDRTRRDHPPAAGVPAQLRASRRF